ncbi:hypothetical protein H5410_046971 [Solanum commersonii]|uniref:Uncharacterized protein n=1 Tax=Solanum commersonii TaxID=4109 RepID=A0A9J5XDQ2_SOLCO|nr:hypothetical protein H5410_046971 [Solanum commersonii]
MFVVRNLQKIRSLSIKLCHEKLVKIQAPTLEYLSYSSYRSLDELDIVEYQNLKTVEMSFTSGRFIERRISRSHFLERVIDAPNLVSLEHEGYLIPLLKFAKESSKLKNFILNSSRYHLDVEWFCRLMEFLSNSTSSSKVSLHISKCD